MPDRPSPLIAQHETWLSLDPVQGCPADCVYCYLQPRKLTRTAPVVRAAPEAVYDQLLASPFFRNNRVPVCAGNQTDMGLTPANRAYLLALLQEHRRRVPEVPFCVITKAVLPEAFLAQMDAVGVTVLIFISLACLPPAYERGAPPPEQRYANFRRIAGFRNLHAIHFWRPILPEAVPDPAAAMQQIERLQDAGARASVITGLKYGPALLQRFREDESHPLHDYVSAHAASSDLTNEIFQPHLRAAILAAARERRYPVYLHTSCAVSYVLGRPDYNATFRRPHRADKCLVSHCPPEQRAICATQEGTVPSPSTLAEVAGFLDLPPAAVSYDEADDIIAVDSTLTQEEQSFLTHATGFTVRGQRMVPTLEWVGSIHRKDKHDAS